MADEAIRNCSELETRLTPFVDGEDAAAPRRAVEAHLAACPPCQQEADAEAAARALVHQHREQLRVAAPPALRARCAGLSASARVSARPASFVRRWAPLSLAATLVLAIAGVFLFGINKPVEATRWVRVLGTYRSRDFELAEMVLVESHLGQGPGGRPRYDVVHRCPVGAG